MMREKPKLSLAIMLSVALHLVLGLCFILPRIAGPDRVRQHIGQVRIIEAHVLLQPYVFKRAANRVIGSPAPSARQNSVQARARGVALSTGRLSAAHAASPKKLVAQQRQRAGKVNQLLMQLHDDITQQQRYPALARAEGVSGSVTLQFNLSPNGSVTHARVVSESGARPNPSLVQAALATLRAITPVRYAHQYLDKAQTFRIALHYAL